MPKVLSQLLEKLQQDFPVVPEVLGYLVPHQINLWIGAAPEGMSRPVKVPLCRRLAVSACLALDTQSQSSVAIHSMKSCLIAWLTRVHKQWVCAGSSSGLHHDYHDNLYCLLRGRKRFRLYPPAMARRLSTRGAIHKIHPNGRIVYEGQVGNVGVQTLCVNNLGLSGFMQLTAELPNFVCGMPSVAAFGRA